MLKLKIVKILFFVGALSFIARPFLGFALVNDRSRLVEDSILLKIFAKRKPELSEDGGSSFSAIEKKLANPNLDIFPRFNNFLDVLFPAAFQATDARSLTEIQPPPNGQTWLLCKKLLI
jgi:hypothetical protein